MNNETGEVQRFQDDKVPEGFTPLGEVELKAISHLNIDQQDELIDAWNSFISARSRKTPIMDKIKMRQAFVFGWVARDKR